MAERKSFGQLRNVLEMPDLIGLQVDSYDNFLQRYVPPAERKRQGLQEIFIDPATAVIYTLPLGIVAFSAQLAAKNGTICP